MALDKNDLKAIKEIVNDVVDTRLSKTETSIQAVDSRISKTEASLKDYVDSSNAKLELGLKDYVEFAIEKSEQKIENSLSEIKGSIHKIEGDIHEINRNLNDMIETDQKFLEVLSGHENRIVCVETKLGIKTT